MEQDNVDNADNVDHVDRLYQQMFVEPNEQQPIRARVSVFDVDYPSPDRCRQILANNRALSTTMRKPRKRQTEKMGLNSSAIGNTNRSIQSELYYEQLFSRSDPSREARGPAFDNQVLVDRFIELIPDCEGIEEEVLVKIFEVAESHLLNLLQELMEVSYHRHELLRTNPNYLQLNDPRKQLKFVEDYEKAEAEFQEFSMKEISNKAGNKTKIAGKSKRKGRDVDEEKLNHNANEVAIAALGGLREQNWNSSAPSSFVEADSNIQSFRPRICRIGLRDFLCLLDCKNSPESVIIRNHSTYRALHYFEQHGSI